MISKLIKINLPHYLVKWISYYLKERDFCVKIGEFQSEAKPIRCGVPQGAVLSPTLFSIYINDTPILYDKNKAYSLLFADDLATFFIFKKINKTESRIRTYMKQLEIWLGKWRLTMHAKKCNQMIFNNNSNKNINKNHSFKLYNETIPACETLKFLGITFDLGLTFKEHVIDIKKKCINRLNIIKILSNRKWKLDTETLKTIYLSLIRSILDYSSLIMPYLSKTLTKTIQSTQNTAFKIIYKLRFDTATEEVVTKSGIQKIKDRAQDLNENFIKNAIENQNELILNLIEEYKIGGKNFKNKTLLCSCKILINDSSQ